VQYVLQLAEEHPERRVLVVIPEMVEEKWYEYFLHNQRSRLLEWSLLAKGNQRIYTVAAPYYLSTAKREEAEAAKIGAAAELNGGRVSK
jgi:hypothetical protein